MRPPHADVSREIATACALSALFGGSLIAFIFFVTSTVFSVTTALPLALLAGAVSSASGLLFFRRRLDGPLSRLAATAKSGRAGETRAGDLPGGLADLGGAVRDLAVRLAKAEQAAADRAAELEALRRDQVRAAREAEQASRREVQKRASLVDASKALEGVAGNIRAFVDSLDRQAESVSSGARTQQERVGEAAAAMEQMDASVAGVARSAADTATLAERTREAADRGRAISRQAVRSMESVSQSTAALGQGLGALGQRAENIGQVLGVIAEIADQTNLLALNAAIEAARAGDAGRGFAVVADEVRKLAEKTMAATRDIESFLAEIRDGARASVARMDEASASVDRTLELSRGCGQALDEIAGLAEDTAGQVRAIATAASQQSAASREIERTMQSVESFSAETAEGMATAARSIHDLGGQIEELVKLSGVFRLVAEDKVQQAVASLAAHLDPAGPRERMEQAMAKALRENPFLELLYVTDATGRQITSNIGANGLTSAQVYGKDWSGRPWFRGALESGSLYFSPIYVSEATGEYCLTVSAVLPGKAGELAGVLGADVRLFG